MIQTVQLRRPSNVILEAVNAKTKLKDELSLICYANRRHVIEMQNN